MSMYCSHMLLCLCVAATCCCVYVLLPHVAVSMCSSHMLLCLCVAATCCCVYVLLPHVAVSMCSSHMLLCLCIAATCCCVYVFPTEATTVSTLPCMGPPRKGTWYACVSLPQWPISLRWSPTSSATTAPTLSSRRRPYTTSAAPLCSVGRPLWPAQQLLASLRKSSWGRICFWSVILSPPLPKSLQPFPIVSSRDCSKQWFMLIVKFSGASLQGTSWGGVL